MSQSSSTEWPPLQKAPAPSPPRVATATATASSSSAQHKSPPSSPVSHSTPPQTLRSPTIPNPTVIHHVPSGAGSGNGGANTITRLSSGSALGSEMQFPTFIRAEELGCRSPDSDEGDAEADAVSLMSQPHPHGHAVGPTATPASVLKVDNEATAVGPSVQQHLPHQARAGHPTLVGSPLGLPLGHGHGAAQHGNSHHHAAHVSRGVRSPVQRSTSPQVPKSRTTVGIQRQRDNDVVRNTNLMPEAAVAGAPGSIRHGSVKSEGSTRRSSSNDGNNNSGSSSRLHIQTHSSANLDLDSQHQQQQQQTRSAGSSLMGVDDDAGGANLSSSDAGDADCPFSSDTSNNRTRKVPPLTLMSVKQMILHGHKPPTCFALFGSFERSRIFYELISLCRDPKTKSFIRRVHDHARLNEQLPGDASFLAWLDDAKDLPPESFFSQPLVAWPLHTLISLGCYYQTAERVGFSTLVQALRCGGIVSTGKGFLAAIAASLGDTAERFVESSTLVLRISIAVGTLYQRHADTLLPIVECCPKQCFQLLLVNIPVSALQLLIAQANQVDIDGAQHMMPLSELQICRVISQRSCVVCGHPLDLLRLDMLLTEYANETGVKIHKDFLPAVVPENSPHYNQALLLELVHCLRDEDLIIDAHACQVPIFSPVNGSELHASQHFMVDLAGALTCVPQDLTYSLQHIRETDTLFDFTVAELSIGQMIAWSKRSTSVVAVPADRPAVSALPSPRRSAHHHVIVSTMAKCATINDILEKLHFASKPKRSYVTHLGSSFVDLGLLLDIDRVFFDGLTSPNTSVTSPGRVAAENLMLLGGANGSTRSLLSAGGGGVAGGGTSVSSRRGLGPKMFSMSLSTVTAYVEPAGTSEVETKTFHSSQRAFVVIPASNTVGINVFQISPLIRYLELQHRCVLTQPAIDFAAALSQETRLSFPQYTLLMCPTVFALMELWDALEFVERLATRREQQRAANQGRSSGGSVGIGGAAAAGGGGGGRMAAGASSKAWRSQAEVRQTQLRRILHDLRASHTGGGPPASVAATTTNVPGLYSPPDAPLSN